MFFFMFFGQKRNHCFFFSSFSSFLLAPSFFPFVTVILELHVLETKTHITSKILPPLNKSQKVICQYIYIYKKIWGKSIKGNKRLF